MLYHIISTGLLDGRHHDIPVAPQLLGGVQHHYHLTILYIVYDIILYIYTKFTYVSAPRRRTPARSRAA